MRLFSSLPFLMTCLLLIGSTPSHADCFGKFEIGPAYAHVDVIESKKTVKDIDMAAIRSELSYVFKGGWYVKPTALYGNDNEGELTAVGISFGRCIPIGDKYYLSPHVGINYTNLSTAIHIEFDQIGRLRFHERFRSVAPFIGIEGIYKICQNLRLGVTVQYAWSNSKTRIKNLLDDTTDSQGPTYGLLLEYDLNCDWSINLGGVYNESYSREKNGIRGRGLKLGIARWF